MTAAELPLHSAQWYRVAALRPQLPTRARLHRHHYRGERWYLLQDPASGRVHRVPATARALLAAMDGQRTVDELWQLTRRRLADAAPTQDEVIQLLGQLHASDLLRTDAAPDALEVFSRGDRQRSAKQRRGWANPMAIRLPLGDPGPWLDRHVGLWRRLWGLPGGLAWLVVVLPALLLLPGAWAELTGNLSDRALAPDNLLLVALVFPLIKALHELGHASATRARGGEVHDIGLMLLVGLPVPYVDASAATVFPSRWQRALVGAAGMAVELFVAALAFYAWLALEPGLARALSFNVMLVAGVSTLLFNGNPLLRYDAYYMLADLAELPNLAQRTARYWGYLTERHLLRVRDATSNAHTTAERWWFGLYGPFSLAYRVSVTLGIALFIARQYFFVGVLLALWTVAAMALVPLLRALASLQARPALREKRRHIVGLVVLLGAFLAAFATGVPLPQRTQAEGVLWLPEQAILRAGADGFVRQVDVAPGAWVQAGQPLVQRGDPALDARIAALDARVAELEAQFGVDFVADRTRADQWREPLAAEQRALALARDQAARQPLLAGTSGRFTPATSQDLTGRWHRQGEVLGYVLGGPAAAEPLVRVVVEQAEADLVASATRAVSLRLADELGVVRTGRIVRQVPAGHDEAPSPALLAGAGGRLATDPRDPQGRKTLARVFEIDVALQSPLGRPAAFGQRVYLRFEHEHAPLATQAWRAWRRLFLRHFDV